MAQVTLDLNQFKAAGVYTLEYDRSESIIITSQIIRLIIGFSRKGPFNAPVYLPDKKTALRVYGDVDDFLERRGVFFHRAILSALNYGPVFGLSLMKLNNDPAFGDKVPYQSFSLATTEANGRKVYKLYGSYYNQERFWYPDQDYLLANVNTAGSINEGKILNMVNLGQTPVSIIIKKASVLNWNITAREHFGVGRVPSYINEWDIMADYFMDIHVIEGNWTNYLQLSIDPVYSAYFDNRGMKKDQMRNFFNDDSINVLGSWTGSIIPDLEDGNGISHSLDVIVNQQLASTGIFIAIDKDTLENYDVYANEDDADLYSAVDMIGHNFANPNRTNPDIIDFLSYKTAIKEELGFSIKNAFGTADIWNYEYNSISMPVSSDSAHYGGTIGYLDNVLTVPKPFNVEETDEQLIDYLTMKNLLIPGESLLRLKGTWAAAHQYGLLGADRWATIEYIWEETDATSGLEYLKIAWSHPVKEAELLIPGLTISELMGDEVALLDATEDAEYLLMMTTLGFSGKMHAVINRPSTSGTAQTRFDALYTSITTSVAPVGMSYLPKVGQDIMIENKTAKSWYYFKIADPGLIAYPFDAAAAGLPVGDYDGYGDIGYGNEGLPSTHKIIIPVDTTSDVGDAFQIIDATLTKFSLYTGSLDYVESSLGLDTAGIGLYPEFVYEPDLMKFVEKSVSSTADASATNPNIFVASKGSTLYEYYDSSALQNGDKWYYAAADYATNQDSLQYFYATYAKDKDDEGLSVVVVQFWDNYVDGKFSYSAAASSLYHGYNILPEYLRLRGEDGTEWLDRVASENDTDWVDLMDGATSPTAVTSWPWYSDTGTTNPTQAYIKKIYLYVSADELYDPVEIIDNSWNAYKTVFEVKQEYGTLIEKGDYIVSLTQDVDGNDIYMQTKVLSKKKQYNSTIAGYAYEYTVNQSVEVNYVATLPQVVRYKPLESFIQSYQLFHLDGFSMNDYHYPGGTSKQAQMWKILGMLDPANSNLMEVLKDREVISYRYVVDTFDGGLEPMTGAKSWMTRLAKERQKCLALMNMPSMKDFQNSNDPRFTEPVSALVPKPVLNTAYIAEGGNQTLGPSFSFTLPDEDWGSKFCGYFAPFLTLKERGKRFDVPPAPWVSNLYVRKHAQGNPWGIVAGPKRGILSDQLLAGLEYDFLLRDRENLEPFGVNPIVKKRNLGMMIYANVMAYQKTKSAFNSLHVRDLLITIEEAVEDVLANFLFEFNDSNTRLVIKSILESYLSNVRTQGGIYDYAVYMDESNNTPEVIDANTGIVDVAIEPAKGLEKFINRVTIMKTGGIASGGFSAAL